VPFTYFVLGNHVQGVSLYQPLVDFICLFMVAGDRFDIGKHMQAFSVFGELREKLVDDFTGLFLFTTDPKHVGKAVISRSPG